MSEKTAPSLVVRGGTALLGTELEAQDLGEMAVRDGLISAVGSEAGAEDANGAVVDADGGFVLPGLVDAHVHLALPGGLASLEDHFAPPSVRLRIAVINGFRSLAAGVTSARDLGAIDSVAVDYTRLALSYPGFGPRTIASRRYVIPVGGHGAPVGVEVSGAQAAGRAARAEIDAGAGVVKVMASGGFSSKTGPDAAGLTVDELRAAVDEAHAAGILAAAHAHSAEGIAAALEAGIDSVEHGAYISPSEIDQMLARNAVLVPTLASMECVERGRGVPDWIVEPCIRERGRYYDNVARALAAGVRVATGTDAGSELNPHGRVVDEMELLARLGLSHLDALRAATVTAGSLIGPDVGWLGVGAAADIIVVDGDPRDDLGALRSPRAVIAGGALVDLEGMRASVARAQTEPTGADPSTSPSRTSHAWE